MIINNFYIIFSLFTNIFINILYNKYMLSYIIYKWSYMTKLLDQKNYI
jgi:hypothetical protein